MTSKTPSTQAAGTPKVSSDVLRQFYFSGAQNFSAFKSRVDSSQNSPSNPRSRPVSSTPTTYGAPSSAAAQQDVRATTPAAIVTTSSVTPAASSTQPVAATVASGSSNDSTGPTKSRAAAKAMPAAKSASGAAVQAARSQQQPAASSGAPASGDAVSPEYIEFLRQQQELVKGHHRIAAQVDDMLKLTDEQRRAHDDARNGNAELLAVAERSTHWHWKSKFTKEVLQKDAGLVVPEGELRQPDESPNLTEAVHQHQRLVKLRQDHVSANPERAASFGLVLENGIRRYERLQRELQQSQLDSTPLVQISDRLIVQLDHVLSLPPLSNVLGSIVDTIAVISKKHQECSNIRDQAMEDGEMHVAERETYRLADLGEDLASAQIQRIQLLRRVAEDIAVSCAVREEYETACTKESTDFENRNTSLKQRCEADLAALYQLKRQVDDTENSMNERWTAERKASDEKLQHIAARQQEAWDQIQSLLKHIQSLETERHQEFKRRIDEKVKDEARRNEYTVFTGVANERAAALDRTVRDCDVAIHCAKLQLDFMRAGFAAIQHDLEAKRSSVDSLLLEARRDHLDIYRSLLFTLGDIEYKKQKRREELDANIQAAHIQQELCSDSLNPNAKKFSDAKKELMRVRDDLEVELRELAERQQAATNQFDDSESALVAAGVEHVHPMEALEERRLAMRAKMVEYKAMSLGIVGHAPVTAELEVLKRSMNETREKVSMVKGASPNATQSGMSASALFGTSSITGKKAGRPTGQ